ncbi:MAG: SDR family oxidoreductase, partial [Proteobacteria bacterium]|nr:SDR family oxidoreductase [Pseudomonadota bacterium]
MQADLREAKEAEQLFADALDTFSQIDVLIVNAGIWNPQSKPLCDMTVQQWDETIAADLTSAFLTCRAFLRHLKKKARESASIVLVGSTAALFGEAGHADYSAAKAALTYGLTA